MARVYLNEDVVRELAAPAKGAKTYFFRGAIIQGKEVPRGFGIQVTAGSKTWCLVYREKGGRQRRETIGRWPFWSCVKAARRAKELREALDRGEAIGRVREIQEADERGPTVSAVLDKWVQAHQHLRTVAEYQRTFDVSIKPRIGERRVYGLQRHDMAELRDAIGAPVMASRAMSYLRSVFNWLQANDGRFNNPIVRGQVRNAAKVRERTLSDNEIDTMYAALAEGGDWPSCWPAYVKVLLLTAARRQEAASMRIEEIEVTSGGARLWVLPGHRYKTKQIHAVPLSRQAWAIIKAEIGTRRTGYVFSTDGGETALGGFSKPLRTMYLMMSAERQRRRKSAEIEAFSLHDLRRTARTLMSRLEIPADTAERCLGHVLTGVRKAYDKWTYYDAKKVAFQKLADTVDGITAEY